MKKKLLVFTLCFTLIFSSLNYKKSYADGGIISLPMLATVSSLAVGTGIIINNIDDLYDLGSMFYSYIDRHNDLTWATVQSVFASCVSLQPNKLVSVKSDFLDIVKDFFDSTFSDTGDKVISKKGFYPRYFNVDELSSPFTLEFGNGYKIVNKLVSTDLYSIGLYYGSNANSITGLQYKVAGSSAMKSIHFRCTNKGVSFAYYLANGTFKTLETINWSYFGDSAISFPYSGGYTWDNVNDKLNDNNELPLPIPGDLSSLVGQGSTDFWDNTDNLVGNGDLSLPSVGDPSISVDSSVGTFPSVDSPSTSVPSDGIWATIKEFIISLVVPSDTFWTDTWGGLYNNFTSSFPMVDMDGFNDLVTGEKKFPNIDINIMGVSGRVVNGDVINSIVDWLRPIIAGFMMLCLMLFNYRKIYKLIRNSEPFGGIAPGTSDFSTGISEYSKQEVVKATDMVAEYRVWKERGGK